MDAKVDIFIIILTCMKDFMHFKTLKKLDLSDVYDLVLLRELSEDRIFKDFFVDISLLDCKVDLTRGESEVENAYATFLRRSVRTTSPGAKFSPEFRSRLNHCHSLG